MKFLKLSGSIKSICEFNGTEAPHDLMRNYRESERIIPVTPGRPLRLGLCPPAVISADSGMHTVNADLHVILWHDIVNMMLAAANITGSLHIMHLVRREVIPLIVMPYSLFRVKVLHRIPEDIEFRF